MLIAFEGGDGAGKTTLIEKVFTALCSQGRSVFKTRAPGGTPIGEVIRNLLLHPPVELSKRCELFLFLADRAQHVDACIAPALRRGEIVLCDRFNDSTVAYQGSARGFGVEWVQKLCAFATHDLQPDLTLYLDLDPVIGLARVQRNGNKDRIESEKLEFHQQIRRAFHALAAEEPNRLVILDAGRPADEVFQSAMEKIHALF